jgi:hypothetical protein
MIDAVRAKLDGAGNVECVRAGFLSYHHTGAPPDFVYTRNALHHLPDFWKAVALERIASLLPAHGKLRLRDLVFSYEPADVEAGIAAWLDRAVASSEAGWTRAELETHLRDEFSTFTWLLEPMLEHAGFEIVDVEYAPIGAYADYTCSRRVR